MILISRRALTRRLARTRARGGRPSLSPRLFQIRQPKRRGHRDSDAGLYLGALLSPAAGTLSHFATGLSRGARRIWRKIALSVKPRVLLKLIIQGLHDVYWYILTDTAGLAFRR